MCCISNVKNNYVPRDGIRTDLLVEFDVETSGRQRSFTLGQRVPRLVVRCVCRGAVDGRKWRFPPFAVRLTARILDDTLATHATNIPFSSISLASNHLSVFNPVAIP